MVPKQSEYPSFLGVLWNFLRPHRIRFFFGSFFGIIADVVWLFPAYATGKAVSLLSTWQTGMSLTPLYTLAFLWLVAMGIRVVCKYLARMLCISVAERIRLDVQLQAVDHLYALDMAWHEQENSGNKMKRIERGADGFVALGRMWVNTILEICVTLTGIFLVIAYTDLRIALSCLFFMVLFLAVAHPLHKKSIHTIRLNNEKTEQLTGTIFEGMHSIRTTKVLSLTHQLLDRMKRISQESFTICVQRIRDVQTRVGVITALNTVFKVGFFVFIGIGIAHGKYEVGFLVLFHSYLSRIQDILNNFSDAIEGYLNAKHSILRLMDILALPIYKQGRFGKKEFPRTWKTLHLNNVHFSYGEKDVLRGITFSVRKGERIGIVGPSGGGKSTLFKLLLKENEDYSGDILFNTTPLKIIKKESYYRHATVVLQDTEVFHFSLQENITIAHPREAHNKKLLDKALTIAHVHPFLAHLPQGLATLLGEKGVKLSGGEKQRVGIARAVFKQPDILFLDEATSHLDLASEEKIQAALHDFFKEVTAIVIAHRLSTIKEMDRILYLDNGVIIEEGTFDELYGKKGKFYELWNKQKIVEG